MGQSSHQPSDYIEDCQIFNSVYPYDQDKSQQILSILELVVLSLIKNLMSGNYQHDKIKGNH